MLMEPERPDNNQSSTTKKLDIFTLEDHLSLRKFKDLVAEMSENQLRTSIVDLFIENKIQQIYYIKLIGHNWGILPPDD